MPIPTPNSLPEALDRSITYGSGRLLAPFLGAGALLPGSVGRTMKGIEKQAADFTEANRDSLNRYGNHADVTHQFVAELPGQFLAAIPEAVNVMEAAPAWATRFITNPALRQSVAKAIPTVANATYAAGRSYLADKDIGKALKAAAFNVVGEKLEPSIRATGISGNALGGSAEALSDNANPSALWTALKLMTGNDESQQSALNPKYKSRVEDALRASR